MSYLFNESCYLLLPVMVHSTTSHQEGGAGLELNAQSKAVKEAHLGIP